MKDSQDWLDEILDKLKLFTKTPLGRMTPEQDEATLDWRQAKSAIREHFLKEALEMIKDWREQGCPNTKLEGSYCNKCNYCLDRDNHDFGRGYDFSKAELRNKFNDKYKED